MSIERSSVDLRKAKALLIVFICGLVLSGVSAFPLEFELNLLVRAFDKFDVQNDLTGWINEVHLALLETNVNYPFLSYGTDWLAFGHIVIALFFVGPLRDPVRNIWIIDVGLIACLLVFPLAFIAGSIRGIPLLWRFIDCSFGFIGGLLLLIIKSKIRRASIKGTYKK